MAQRFADQLFKARLREGLSQTELGDKLGVSQAAVSNWELGRTEPRQPQLENLRRVLGISSARGGRPSEAESSGADDIFGAWLRRARIEAEMSVPELSQTSGVSAMAIYNIEAGKSSNPQPKTRERLEKALGAIPEEVKEESTENQTIIGIGALIDFDPHDEEDLPISPGVYVFYDITNRPVYVGKAESIAKRVRNHQDKFWFKSPIVSNAAYVEIKDSTLRHQVEQVLIKFLKSNALINKQGVARDDEI